MEGSGVRVVRDVEHRAGVPPVIVLIDHRMEISACMKIDSRVSFHGALPQSNIFPCGAIAAMPWVGRCLSLWGALWMIIRSQHVNPFGA